jgi:hypothetical protein
MTPVKLTTTKLTSDGTSTTKNGEVRDSLPAALARIQELELHNERLALSNRMLRDRLRDLIDLLADFGVYQPS